MDSDGGSFIVVEEQRRGRAGGVAEEAAVEKREKNVRRRVGRGEGVGGGRRGVRKDDEKRGGEQGCKGEGKSPRGSRENGATPARNFGIAAIAAGGRGRADAAKEKSPLAARKSSARRTGKRATRYARQKK